MGFHIYVVGSSKICARRLDKSYGWPFRLGIKCFKRAVKTKKTIYLGKFRGSTKCVHVRKWKPGVYCRCGRAGKGADGMTWYPDKRFHIYTTTDKVCARRKDKKTWRARSTGRMFRTSMTKRWISCRMFLKEDVRRIVEK